MLAALVVAGARTKGVFEPAEDRKAVFSDLLL
jgi:hypothetical protein